MALKHAQTSTETTFIVYMKKLSPAVNTSGDEGPIYRYSTVIDKYTATLGGRLNFLRRVS